MPDSLQRRYFRLRYPRSKRPELLFEGEVFSLIEISEEGLRIALSEADSGRFPLRQKVDAVIRFSDGTNNPVVGTVIRIVGKDVEEHCVLNLSEGIPFGRVMSEQRTLLRDFPAAGSD